MLHRILNFQVLIFCFAIFALLPSFALAHIAVQDGNVMAVLHIDPGDSPIVGQPAHLHFDFTGSKEMFDVSKCDCTVTISAHDTVLFDKKTTEPEFELDKESITLMYTFPSKAVYTIVAHGTTGPATSSTPFSLSYDIRVDRGDATPTASTVSDFFTHTLFHHGFHVLLFGGAFIVGGYFTYRDWKKKSLSKPES